MLNLKTSTALFVFSQAMFLFVFRSCNPTVANVYTPDELKKFYIQNDWVPLPAPDSKFEPGVIFEVTQGPTPTVRWISSLKTCGIPDDISKPIVGNTPHLNFEKKPDYEASAVLNFKGVEVGPDFSHVKDVTLDQEDQGGDALDFLKVKIWLADPANAAKIPQTCKDYLNAPNHYIAGESYRVSKGKYTLHAKNGATIKASNGTSTPVKFNVNFQATVTTDGSIEFTQPVYTAVRRVVYANGDFTTLGDTSKSPNQDPSLNKLLYPKLAGTK